MHTHSHTYTHMHTHTTHVHTHTMTLPHIHVIHNVTRTTLQHTYTHTYRLVHSHPPIYTRLEVHGAKTNCHFLFEVVCKLTLAFTNKALN